MLMIFCFFASHSQTRNEPAAMQQRFLPNTDWN